MNDKSYNDAVMLLETERDKLLQKANALTVSIEFLKLSVAEVGSSPALPPKVESNGAEVKPAPDPLPFSNRPNGALKRSGSEDANFPKNGSIAEQQRYLFSQHLKQAVRFPVIEESYRKASGSVRSIRADVMKARKEGVLTAIIFNDLTQLTYIGLSEWVIESEKGPIFKEEFFDAGLTSFPKGIWQSKLAEASKSN